MAPRFFEGSSIGQVNLRVVNVESGLHQQGLRELLQPITDASHTRDRKRSPPDSACPGREKV
ncbi:hypothetical protein EST38_g10956 [Candolleomyces aberdarensis]|uniref:Uncharacterized protein n=1 Tax=Candolleomyces aberdarensis TaxID=2316362 RepID=A0A4Q2D648_9AGAR|nr:hypothetical protein EST38_g10956 [Candolleomyces aberdarensis]